MIHFKIKRTNSSNQQRKNYFLTIFKNIGLGSGSEGWRSHTGHLSQAVHTICLHPHGRLPAKMTLPSSSPPVHTPHHQDTETTLPPLKSGLALWLALAIECGHTIWFLSLDLKSLPAPVFFCLNGSVLPCKQSQLSCSREAMWGERSWRRGSAQPAPGCSSCPSWGARHVRELSCSLQLWQSHPTKTMGSRDEPSTLNLLK